MSVKALTWAFDQPISATDKVVLLALADYANEHGLCWPSISSLVQRAHVGERTVQRALQSLEDAGFITRERRKRENGSDTSNIYRLCLERVCQDVSGGVNLAPHHAGEGVIQTGGEGVTQTGGEGGLHDTPRTVIKNHHKEPSNILVDSEFEEFWAVYPKRAPHPNPKKKARESYIGIRKKKVSHETIINAVRKYAELRKNEDPKFTAQAVTWLNQWRFNDDYTLDSGAGGAAQSASDADLEKLVPLFPGQIGDREAVKRLMAEEFAKGATLDALCEAARKYRLYCKGPPYEDRRIAPAPMDKWLRFKWREMEAYEFCSVGPDRIKTVRYKKVPA